MKKIIFFNIADLIDPHNHPSLGLGYIKAYLLENLAGELEVKIIREKIIETIKKEKPNLIGISAVTQFYTKACKFAKEIRKIFPKVTIVIGGVHISTLPQSFDDVFDFGVIREGELTFLEIAKLIIDEKLKKENLVSIKGLVFKDNGKLVITEPRELIRDLDDIPHIDRSDYNHKSFAHIITSRGCPYACSFCSSTHFWGTRMVRFHSAKYVYEEIKILAKMGVRHISIWDDLFAFNMLRLKELLVLINNDPEIKNKITFGCTARANIVKDDLCIILKKLNVKYVSMGLESGSNDILQKIKGSVTLDDNIKAIHLLHEWGFITKGSFVINNPNETIEDMKLTYELIKKHPLDGGDVNIAIPLPATPYWEHAKSLGLVSDNMDFGKLNIKNDIKKLASGDFIKLTDKSSYQDILFWGNKIQQELHKKELLSFRKLINLKNILIALSNPKFAIKYIYGHAADFFKIKKT